MQALALFLLSVLAACRADTLSQLESYCIRECGTPEYDQLVEELDHQDELLNEVATKAMNLEHKLDEWKHELEEADKESKNMLLRLDRLHSDKEEAVCPKKHFKCLKGDSKRHEKCISDILVCDGEPDCLDGSDEDENLCTLLLKEGDILTGYTVFSNCYSHKMKQQQKIYIERIETNSILKSYAKITARGEFQFRDIDTENVMSVPTQYMYSYGKQTGKAVAQLQGARLKGELEFYPFEKLLFTQVKWASTGVVCGRFLYQLK